MPENPPARDRGAKATHVTADQSEVLDFLSDPASYGLPSGAVTRVDTHGAIVFLAGDTAYKVKRAVAFPYMDFSTLERRHRFCLREREINSRTAPGLYRAVRAVGRGPEGLRLAAESDRVGAEAVEWVLEMRRFEQRDLLSEMAGDGRLTTGLMSDLAVAIAAFHEQAEVHRDRAAGSQAMSWVVRENGAEFAERDDLFDPAAAARLTEVSLAEVDRHGALLDRRAESGQVRLCHGDLHLRNVVLLDDRPTLFDAIEFNDAIACIDVLYDLAFLLMDLEQRDLRSYANAVLNRYLQRRDDLEGLALLPLFLSARAAVRAKVAASLEAVAEADAEQKAQRREAQDYFQRALAYLTPAPARLVAVGGLSGSGKSTLARAIAPQLGRAPGALHLRSDILRKQLAGVAETDRLPPDSYTAEASQQVYAELDRQASRALAAGQSVVVDAVFARPEERDAVQALARKANAAFTGLWLEAPPKVLASRVAARHGDASDADETVVEKQLTYDLGSIEWRRLDAAGDLSRLRDKALEIINLSEDA
jgi:aminoglycoside phosphotransferase family enzyme/predicted kinase